MSAALNLRLSGSEFNKVGFFHSGGNPIVKGWWERKSGSEGGILEINTKTAEVEDFDGACDLPRYIIDELKVLGISCPWDSE